MSIPQIYIYMCVCIKCRVPKTYIILKLLYLSKDVENIQWPKMINLTLILLLQIWSFWYMTKVVYLDGLWPIEYADIKKAYPSRKSVFLKVITHVIKNHFFDGICHQGKGIWCFLPLKYDEKLIKKNLHDFNHQERRLCCLLSIKNMEKTIKIIIFIDLFCPLGNSFLPSTKLFLLTFFNGQL